MDYSRRSHWEFVGQGAAPKKPRRPRASPWGITVGNAVIIILLLVLVGLMTAGLVVLIVKKPEIHQVWDTMVTARQTLRSVNDGIDQLHALRDHYNLSAMDAPDREELQHTLSTVTHGLRDFAGLVSEIRGSDLLTRFSKLAYTADLVLGDPENRRSVRRILQTTAEALEGTTHDDIRSIVAAFDFSGLHECLDTADRALGKVRSIVDEIVRSGADSGLSTSVDKLVKLAKDPEFKEMLHQTPILFQHLTEIIQSDEFKSLISASGQVLDRADSVLQETERADLVGRSDRVLVRVEHIAAQAEGIVDDLEQNGINIAVGHNERLRALPAV